MKLIWKGKLTEETAFQYPKLPENAVSLHNPKYEWTMYLLIVPVLALAYAAIQIRLPHIDGIMFSRPALLVGVVLALALLIVHEFIHAIFCPKAAIIYAYYSSAGISLVPTCKLGKARYLVVAAMPNLILGIVPLIIWTTCPQINATIGSIIFTIAIGSLAMGIGDIYNIILAIAKMPQKSSIVTSGMNCYFFPEHN